MYSLFLPFKRNGTFPLFTTGFLSRQLEQSVHSWNWKEKVTPKHIHFVEFVNANRNVALSIDTRRNSSFLKCRFRLHRSPKFEHRWRHFEQYSAARPRFRDVIPFERWLPKRLLTATLGHGCSWAMHVLFWAKHALNSKIENCVEKIVFADLLKSIAGFSPCCYFKLDWMKSHKHSLVDKTVSKWQPPKLMFQDEFLQDSGHFRGWNFSEWKSWMFTCYRWRQKSKLPWVT